MRDGLIEQLQLQTKARLNNAAIGDDAVRQAVQAEQAGVVAQDIYPGLGVLTIGQICQALGMSRSGYYARRAAAKQRLAEPAVCAQSVHLKAAFAASYKACGSRRLRTAMAERGQPMGRHRVRTLILNPAVSQPVQAV